MTKKKEKNMIYSVTMNSAALVCPYVITSKLEITLCGVISMNHALESAFNRVI